MRISGRHREGCSRVAIRAGKVVELLSALPWLFVQRFIARVFTQASVAVSSFTCFGFMFWVLMLRADTVSVSVYGLLNTFYDITIYTLKSLILLLKVTTLCPFSG